MTQTLTNYEAIARIETMIEDGWNQQHIFEYFVEEGFSKNQIFNLFVETGLSKDGKKLKNQEATMNQEMTDKQNPLESALGGLLTLAITYGIPILLMLFGLAYVWGEITTDLDVGIRSAAAVIMPMAITLAFAKSDIRHNTANFLSDNKFVAFGFAFALAMVAAAAAMWMRDFNNIIPVGELAFSTTLALMVFGNHRDGEVSLVHVGAVSGLLTYVVLFGVAV